MSPGTVRTVLRRYRLAAASAFFVQAFVFISLTTRLPDVKDEWDLDDTSLSGVLLMMVLLAGAGSLAAEKLAARLDSATVLRLGLALATLAVPTLGGAPSFGVFLLGMAGYGVALGIIDATSNMQAVAVEQLYERPILPSFYGAWTLGGTCGAGIAIATAHLSLAQGVSWTAVLPALALLAPFLRHERTPSVAAPIQVPGRTLLALGATMMLFYMVDTAAQTWGPTYLDDVFSTPERLVPLATFPYLLAVLVLRFAGDALVARFGAVPLLRVGAVIACAALAIVVCAPSWQVAVVGFTLLGAGVAVVAPLSFSAAARLTDDPALDPAARRARTDALMARFNQFNYGGALLGSVMTGLVGSGSLRLGFALPMVLVLLIWPLSAAFRDIHPITA